jgi:hypothetical protein
MQIVKRIWILSAVLVPAIALAIPAFAQQAQGGLLNVGINHTNLQLLNNIANGAQINALSHSLTHPPFTPRGNASRGADH